MAEYVVKLPWLRPPLTLNSKGGRAERWRLSVAIKRGVAPLVKMARIPRGIDPVTVELVWYPGNNRVADSDNIALTLKYCIDALVDVGILPQDSPRYVVRTSQRVIPRDLDPADRSTPAMFLVVNTCEYADMPHYGV